MSNPHTLQDLDIHLHELLPSPGPSLGTLAGGMSPSSSSTWGTGASATVIYFK